MHFKGLDLNLLVILDALLEEQSVTRAAEKVHVSQPAVSAALAKLRRHTGDELLEKVGRKTQLTPRAKAMAKPVKEILLQIESTIYADADFDPAQTSRIFKIAMSDYSSEVLLPGLVEKISSSYPGISCMVEEISEESLGRVKNGKIDCCVTFQQTKLLNPAESTEDLSHFYLFSDEWLLIAAKNNKLVSEDMSYEDFCALPYIATRLGRSLSSFVERTLDQKNYRPPATLSVPSFELAITSVINSQCVSVVPGLLVEDRVRPALKMFTPPFELPTLAEYLVWHSRNDADPAHSWFRELMLDVALGLKPSARKTANS